MTAQLNMNTTEEKKKKKKKKKVYRVRAHPVCSALNRIKPNLLSARQLPSDRNRCGVGDRLSVCLSVCRTELKSY